MLALYSHLARNQPDQRVIEQNGLDGQLQHIHQVIVATDMRQLMHQQRFEVIRIRSGESGRRNQNHRAEPADHERRNTGQGDTQ